MDEIVREFLQESGENLDRLDQEFVRLESEPDNQDLLDSIFRTIHTIKGTCGFLGFTKLEALTHAGENLLALLRAGDLKLNHEIADRLLEMADAVRTILQEIQANETEGEGEYSGLTQRLKDLQGKGAGMDPRVREEETRAKTKTPPGKPPAPGESARETSSSPAAKKQSDLHEAAIRVDVNLLEKQMNLVSELVLLRNRLLQIASEANERNLNAAVHGLNYITSELRKNVMKTRMQPVSQLFDKLPRIVRDVSKELGKKVKLETQGGDTELDKTLLEAIKDPVTHILRNSIDHGIESPVKRVQDGKPEEGTVRIRAFHEGGNFHLEIADDGAGIDAERVKQKALSQGVIQGAHAEKMTHGEAVNLVFLPGLSTAEKVTNVSGRGVGMDVVKTNIERIGGKARLESVRDRGTKVSLEIPLTLATIPALTVISGKSVFAIPQAALVEMIALGEEESQKRIECIDGVSVFRFRGTVLPLLSLREELKLQSAQPADASVVKLVVVHADGRQFALRVDTIRNTEEIVIKPLDKRFKSIALYSGAAVLGDGRVALILDVPAFARRAGVVPERETRAEKATDGKKKERMTLLLLGGSDGERLALPLEYAQRLEELDPAAREHVGGTTMIQYRNEILRLVRLEELIEERRSTRRTDEGRHPRTEQEKISAVVVRSATSGDIIFEVHSILSIANVEIEKLGPPTRGGVKGTLVVQERVTELLDMPLLLSKIHSAGPSPAVLVGAETEQSHG